MDLAGTATIGDRRVGTFEGKTLRSTRDAAGNLVHLLAGQCQHIGTVLAQLALGATTNELTMLKALLDCINNIAGTVINADAAPSQRDTATYITGRGDHTSSR